MRHFQKHFPEWRFLHCDTDLGLLWVSIYIINGLTLNQAVSLASYHLNGWWLSTMTPYGVTGPHWVKCWLWHICILFMLSQHINSSFCKTTTRICNTVNTTAVDDFVTQEARASAATIAWWRHQMKTFSALLAICAGKSLLPGEFPVLRPVTRSFDVFFDLGLNKRLSK